MALPVAEMSQVVLCSEIFLRRDSWAVVSRRPKPAALRKIQSAFHELELALAVSVTMRFHSWHMAAGNTRSFTKEETTGANRVFIPKTTRLLTAVV